jgi:hypothetical protein
MAVRRVNGFAMNLPCPFIWAIITVSDNTGFVDLVGGGEGGEEGQGFELAAVESGRGAAGKWVWLD